ncbi:nuclease-related domain-containing protein [Bacillaceae bacterium S4-13-56]
MIDKPCEKPIYLRQLELLQKRLRVPHPRMEDIETDRRNANSGFAGEKSMDYFLGFLDSKKYRILFNIRLEDSNKFFQMDILLLSSEFFLIVEVKNLAGTILLDPNFRQMIRKWNDIEECFSDPTIQVERQRFRFQEWLIKNKFPTLPIETLIVFSNQNTLLRTTGESNYYKNVIHSEEFVQRVYSLEEKYKKEKISVKELKKVSQQLIKQNCPYHPNIFEKYGIQQKDISTGVICTQCSTDNLKRRKGQWYCPSCNYSDNNAHIAALLEYALLFKTSISNSELRDFLQISSRTVANKLLKQLNFKMVGKGNSVKYVLDIQQLIQSLNNELTGFDTNKSQTRAAQESTRGFRIDARQVKVDAQITQTDARRPRIDARI